jgi:aryl-phospho-beta-D-glucosidase BglC (GH1 family)
MIGLGERWWLLGGMAWVSFVVSACGDSSSQQSTTSATGSSRNANASGGQSLAAQGGSESQTPAQGGSNAQTLPGQGGKGTTAPPSQGGKNGTSSSQGGNGVTSRSQGGSSASSLPSQGGNGVTSRSQGGSSSASSSPSQGGNGTTSSPSQAGSVQASSVAPSSGFWHVEGSRLLDDAGQTVRMTGVNWFGFETSNLSPHGLWARDYRSMLKQIHDVGFNTVRLPWCDAMLQSGAAAKSVNNYGADPYDGTDPMNDPLNGKSPLEIMDLVVKAAGEIGLRLILDNHSRNPDGYMEEKVWYTDSVSEEQWIANWVSMAQRYKGNPTVVGFDLDNEPHGTATWGTGVASTDWNSAAERCGNAILAVNPDVLIVVEGVEKMGTDVYWWGGNLTGARDKPIQLTNPKKLVYSAHEYGPEVFAQPWFTAADFPKNLPDIWNTHFGFLMKENLGHVLIGEFGIKDPTAADGHADTWFKSFLDYAGGSFSWTFWCWNPNSGDTEGILGYDWLTPKQWKLDALKPYLAPQFK